MASEPREAAGLLERLSRKQILDGILPEDDEQRDIYIRWALAEADQLLRNNAKSVDQLSEALAGGAATVGDCVAILEGW